MRALSARCRWPSQIFDLAAVRGGTWHLIAEGLLSWVRFMPVRAVWFFAALAAGCGSSSHGDGGGSSAMSAGDGGTTGGSGAPNAGSAAGGRAGGAAEQGGAAGAGAPGAGMTG